MWAAWWGRMENQLLEARLFVAAGEGQEGLEADAGGGRMRLVCLADGKGDCYASLEKVSWPERVGEDRTKHVYALCLL